MPAASHYQTGCIHSLVDPDSRQIENLVQLRDSVMRLTYEALSLATYAEQMLSYAKTYFDGEGIAVMTELRDRCQKSWLETRALYNSVEKLFGEFTAYKQGQSHRSVALASLTSILLFEGKAEANPLHSCLLLILQNWI